MKKTLYFISAFLFLGVFTSCEKFELDDHCPEENQEQFVDPQELRVNDDSDSEETGKPNVKSTDEEGQHGDNDTSKSHGMESDNSGSDHPGGGGDDTINDDSDNEDEGGRPRNRNGNPSK